MKNQLRIWLCSVPALLMVLGGAGAAESDISMCPSVFPKLTPCLSFVQGRAEIPANGCCDNLNPIYTNTPQCLCELVLAAVNGSASGTSIPNLNITKALQLAPACGINAQPSQCLDMLDIPKDSPTTKIFEMQSNASSTTNPSLSAMTSNSIGGSTKSRSSQVSLPPTLLKLFGILLWVMI